MPTGPARDLSGKKVRCWYVVAYAGQRDGVHYWKCMSRATFAEKVVAERDIISPKANALSSVFARCREAELNPTGWIYGEWTVVGPGEEYDHAPDRKQDSIWKCRCTCGTERDMRKSELRKFRSLSCGCRPHEEVRAERQLKVRQAYEGFEKACAAARRSAVRRELDSGWTPEMEQALRAFQPACVVCGAMTDLTTDHVRAVWRGQGKRPGNVVRLCRVCNSFKIHRNLDKLSPQFAHKVRTAAAQFKAYWKSGCTTPIPPTQMTGAVVSLEELPNLPDPTLVSLLRAVERGDDLAIPALASWLKEHGDPRAAAIRTVANWKVIARETRTQENGVYLWVEFQLNGKRRGTSVGRCRSPVETEESLAQQVRELLTLQQCHQVWRRLGLSESQQSAAKQYLGINQMSVAATIEEIAKREAKKVQTIRHRVELALHLLTVPRRPV